MLFEDASITAVDGYDMFLNGTEIGPQKLLRIGQTAFVYEAGYWVVYKNGKVVSRRKNTRQFEGVYTSKADDSEDEKFAKRIRDMLWSTVIPNE